MRKLRKPKGLVYGATLLLSAAMLLPLGAGRAFAQATTGSVRGTVTDQTGAVMPGATVTAKNQDTGVVSSTYKSTTDGIYVIPTLLPGKYTLSVEAPNFKKAVFTDVEVRLGQVTVIDVGMQAGGASETVTVTANTETVIQKDTSQVSTSFQSRAVEDLPSNVAGVGIDTLALLAPGVTPGFGNVNGNGTTLSVNGNRARSNNFTIDGVDNNDLSIGGPSYFVDNQDQVAEFQVITNNFSAEYGRNQGAIVNIVTKSGTNSFHGSAFEFHRDASNLDSLNNIEKSGGQTGPLPLLYNVFGGTIGGPIIKDKAFFFGSYQGITTRQSAADITGGVAVLASDLGRLAANNPNNAAIQAYSKFSYFAITADGAATVRSGFPVESVTINGVSYAAAVPQKTVVATALTPYSEQEFSGRGDVKVSEKNNVWGRYLFQNPNFKNGLSFGDNGFFGDEPARSQSAAGTWDRQLSAVSFNEFSFSYSRLAVLFGGGCTATTPGCIPDPTQIDQAFTNFSGLGGVRGSITGLGLLGIGPATNLPQGRIVQAFQFKDNYSRTMGRHQFKMGADIRRLKNEVPFLPTVNGNFNFGNSSARLSANDPGTVTLAAGQSTLNYSETDQFYYFQDDWKIKDNLTLNLGLRYEFTGQPINLLADLTQKREANPATALWLQSLPLSSRTVPRVPNATTNFAPRIGFAYTPRFWKKLFGDDATVIRGGYSIAYDADFYNILLNVSTSTPVVFNNVTPNPKPPAAAIFPVPVAEAFGPAVRAFALSNKIFATNLFDPRFFNQTQVANDFHAPYAEQWSLGIQRQITKNDVFEARYLGTHGVGLFQQAITNPQFAPILNGFSTAGFGNTTFTFPGFPNLVPAGLRPQVAGVGQCVNNPATVTLNEAAACNGRILPQARVLQRFNGAQSLYHSLQTRFNGRIGNQLTLGGSYTLSKALDNASEIFAFQESPTSQDPFNTSNAERSYSGFDRRHAIALNGIWDIPFYKDQKGIIGHLAGGWQINSTYIIASGLRYTARQTFNNDLALGLGYGNSYADVVTGDVFKPFNGSLSADPTQVGIFGGDVSLLNNDRWTLGPKVKINPNQLYSLNQLQVNGVLVPVSQQQVRLIVNMPYADKIFGTPFGNSTRNSFVGPLLNQMNLGIFKNIKMKERVTLTLRLEAFNALNHPNPGYGLVSFETANTADNFIDDAGSTFNRNDQVQLARRVVQLGVRLSF